MSRSIGYCPNFPNRAYTFAYFNKPPNKFNGTYTFISKTGSGNRHINATIESQFSFPY